MNTLRSLNWEKINLSFVYQRLGSTMGISLAMPLLALLVSAALSRARSSVGTISNHASSMKWNTDSNYAEKKVRVITITAPAASCLMHFLSQMMWMAPTWQSVGQSKYTSPRAMRGYVTRAVTASGRCVAT